MIPEEAVDAAAKVVQQRTMLFEPRTEVAIARAALEDAAAEIASDGDAGDIHIIAWLHMRAAAERGGE